MSLEQEFLHQIIEQSATALHSEFDRNFENKSFFGKRWPSSRNPKRGGLQQRGSLRGALKVRTSEMSIFFENAVPYAKIHNEGGKIRVTAKMKKYFWAMYLKALGASGRAFFNEDGSHSHTIISTDSKALVKKTLSSKSKRAEKMKAEAEMWKAMALMKVGSYIEIPQRQFLGDHPDVHRIIGKVVDLNFKKIEKAWASQNGFK